MFVFSMVLRFINFLTFCFCIKIWEVRFMMMPSIKLWTKKRRIWSIPDIYFILQRICLIALSSLFLHIIFTENVYDMKKYFVNDNKSAKLNIQEKAKFRYCINVQLRIKKKTDMIILSYLFTTCSYRWTNLM